MSSHSTDLCAQWTGLTDQALTLEDVHSILAPVEDDLWVVAACHDRLLDSVDVQRALLDEGLKRSEPSKGRALNLPLPATGSDSETHSSTPATDDTLVSYFKDEPVDAQILYVRASLLRRLDRLNTFVEIIQALVEASKSEEDAETGWDDDPWADEGSEGQAAEDEEKVKTSPPFQLSTFLVEDVCVLALLAASTASFSSLRVLFKRYHNELWAHRFFILDNIPEHVHPSDFRDLLPTTDSAPSPLPWRAELDVAELPAVRAAVQASGSLPEYLPEDSHPTSLPLPPPGTPDVSSWFVDRVNRILESTGMADIALALVQHGASQGVLGLDELGEELSLMSRMAYRAEDAEDDEDISLAKWRGMDPSAAIRAYLKYSTPDSIVADIRRLVLPYLFVLEARAERAGSPDRTLVSRLLNEYILAAPLDIVAAIFEASKPTLPAGQRLLRGDEEMARLALACLYGSSSLSEWSTMSRIFECLPAWDTGEDEDNSDEGDTTVASLGTFVTPTTSHPQCTPQDLLLFFEPLPASSLSRVLDILDVHLESGEILMRWNVPAPLRWFLQSMRDHAQQKSRATRMSRRHGGSEDHLDAREEWEWLLEDMLKLTGTSEAGVPSAFGTLSKDEVISIFFSGLLSTGRLAIAKDLLRSKKRPLGLKDETIEGICLAASREFYDNASNGNYHFGDMKLAYDCLSVAPSSPQVQEEKDFIEATSRITSFNVLSRPGIPISPLEIRLTKDRLSLVSRVLSSTADAYKYPEVILDLVSKLGLRNDPVATIKALAMLADTALQHEDFSRAHATSSQMVDAALRLTEDPSVDPEHAAEARDVCWVACFQLGRQPEFGDARAKSTLLARTLQLCPPEKLNDILSAWRKLEADDLRERRTRTRTRASAPSRRKAASALAAAGAGSLGVGTAGRSLAARFKGIASTMASVPSSPDPAALAHTFSRVAATFPFSIGGGGRPSSAASFRSDDSGRRREREERGGDGGSSPWTKLDHAGEDVSAQASRALQKGIGWLIGADEE